MNRFLYSIIIVFCLVSCQEASEIIEPTPEGAELSYINANISLSDTRALNTKNSDYIGRNYFKAADVMVLTNLRRTVSPIPEYTYENVRYLCNSNLAWERSIVEGFCNKARVFWSDNASGHTFIGYATPQAWASSSNESVYRDNKWTQDGNTFTGQFDYTTETIDDVPTKIVDFSVINTELVDEKVKDEIGNWINTGNKIDTTGTRLKNEDILLTYNTDQKADASGLTTTLHFRHALASLRVIFDIQGYAPSSGSIDTQTDISDLVVLNQPWKYKWTQTPHTASDETVIPGWGVENNTATDDGTVNIKAWKPRPAGEGTGQAKKFTFYSLIVPGKQQNLSLNYTVKYPHYLNPKGEIQTKKYVASIENINFLPGHTTTLHISLNHEGEPIYIGAVYIDWEDVETPDRGVLQKISNFLDVDNSDDVTIASDQAATKDDATWLYYDGERTGANLKDIYGNTGGQSDPFLIKTARQFLSFAYEVKDGRTFEDKFVSLDSDIFLQSSMTTTNIIWPGIGDASYPFNGTFNGGHRRLKFLNGKPLFAYIGPKGHVGHLILEEVIGCTGNGVFVEKNEGLIGASMVGSRRFNTTNPGAFTMTIADSPAGSFCGTNSGVLLACYSNAMFKVTGSATIVGGLVGENTGTMVSCYAASSIESTKAPMGVVGTNASDASMVFCLFDKDKNAAPEITTNGTDANGAIAKTTLELQKEDIVGVRNSTSASENTLNGQLHIWIESNAQTLGAFFPQGTENSEIKSHLYEIYYNYFVAAYPSIH